MEDLSHVTMPNYRGRKMKPGKLTYDPVKGQLGIFIDYCPGCHAKIITSRETLAKFVKQCTRQQKKLSVRVLNALLRHIE